VVLAVSAHPDDIAIDMAGTLILLRERGYEIHCVSIANGSCGSNSLDTEQISILRDREEKCACDKIGAIHHPGFVNDYEVIYSFPLLQKMSSLIRKVAPDIILTQNISDYMFDHSNTAQITITAAFTKAHKNFPADPPFEPFQKDIVVYIAQPYGNRDQFRRWVMPEIYVDISSVLKQKKKSLLSHKSQVEEFGKDAGNPNALLDNMEGFCKEVGKWSARYEYAEGWRRHSHLGYSKEEITPLEDVLKDVCFVDEEYEKSLMNAAQGDRTRE